MMSLPAFLSFAPSSSCVALVLPSSTPSCVSLRESPFQVHKQSSHLPQSRQFLVGGPSTFFSPASTSRAGPQWKISMPDAGNVLASGSLNEGQTCTDNKKRPAPRELVERLSLPSLKADDSVLDSIGNTPLIRIKRLADMYGIPDTVQVYGKAEWMNPGGSVKDRPARAMILAAEKDGRLTKDKILLDATSGNTGIAYAMICAAKGYRIRLTMSEGASVERRRILKAYGAELILTPASQGTDGAIRKCEELYAADPDLYFYCDQYSNDANWTSHFEGTGPEIIEQTQGRVTHLVAGLGTSGTLVGTGRRLKLYKPSVQAISVQPDVPKHGLEGLKHFASNIIPPIYDPSIVDRQINVATPDAHKYVKLLAQHEGLLVGVSAAANTYAALQVAKEIADAGHEGCVVTVMCDNAFKYLSSAFWDA